MLLLQRLPLTGEAGEPKVGYSEVSKAWAGHTVVCIASGPSLTREQLECVRGAKGTRPLRVIGCNDNYLAAPWADVCYFPDRKWWHWHKDRSEWREFAGQKCTLPSTWGNEAPEPDVHIIRSNGGDGLSTDPRWIKTGSNSGHQMINIACLSGAVRVLLLGYDGQRGANGRKHHFGDHPDRSEPPYDVMLRNIRTIPAAAKQMGVAIVNCTPGSAVDCFEKGEIESLLSDPAPAALSA